MHHKSKDKIQVDGKTLYSVRGLFQLDPCGFKTAESLGTMFYGKKNKGLVKYTVKIGNVFYFSPEQFAIVRKRIAEQRAVFNANLERVRKAALAKAQEKVKTAPTPAVTPSATKHDVKPPRPVFGVLTKADLVAVADDMDKFQTLVVEALEDVHGENGYIQDQLNAIISAMTRVGFDFSGTIVDDEKKTEDGAPVVSEG